MNVLEPKAQARVFLPQNPILKADVRRPPFKHGTGAQLFRLID
jgi:hypothetical protein